MHKGIFNLNFSVDPKSEKCVSYNVYVQTTGQAREAKNSDTAAKFGTLGSFEYLVYGGVFAFFENSNF